MANRGEGPFGRANSSTHVQAASRQEELGIDRFLVHNDPPDPALDQFIRMRNSVVTMVRPHVTNAVWYNSEHYNLVRRPHQIDETLYCRLVLPDGQDLGVGIQRCPGDPPFSDRERATVHMFHSNAAGVYYAPPPAPPKIVDPRIGGLAPRLRNVLERLLKGESEKEAAAKLGLSYHSVHQYTKTLYKELGVSSRSELLSMFIGDRQSGDGAPSVGQ